MWALGIVAGIVAADGCIKNYMEQRGKQANKTYGKISIKHCQNKGAMYSLGQNRPDLVRKASVVINGGVAYKWMIARGKKKNGMEHIGYSMLLGGGISNLWDRWKRGYVVDYLHVNVAYIKKLIFNLSDVCIMFGGILVVLSQLFGEKRK